jgi:hypothetical protein
MRRTTAGLAEVERGLVLYNLLQRAVRLQGCVALPAPESQDNRKSKADLLGAASARP